MCLDLIYDNIYNGIRVQELADKLGLTPQYLSKLFKQEVGVTISDYIMSRRIQAAENMLKFSDYAPLDIGNYMGFSSHSHFIACFKKHTGFTPKQFRENYFRQNWQGKE
ncbi:helix-turn-helix transcriptional regulator [Ruminococcus albus 8]|nr:helix-turn-helix transcriptional regulator [Ruminococcus albus 8]